MHYSIFATLSILTTFVLPAAGGQTYACQNQIKLRLRPDKKTSSDVDATACIELNGGKPFYLDYKDGNVEGTVSTVEAAPAKAICEHIVEVQLLKFVLESANGACAEYEKANEAGKVTIKAQIKQISDIVNDKPNLIFAQPTIEKLKGDLVNAVQKNEKLKVPKSAGAAKAVAIQLHAVNHYLNSQFKDAASQVAAHLDAKIHELFPKTEVKVVDEWKKITDYAAVAFLDFEPKSVGITLMDIDWRKLLSAQGLIFAK